MRVAKIDKNLLIFNTVFFCFQFETIGDGFFSVYKILIFPLLCIGLLIVPKKTNKRDVFPFYFFGGFTCLQLIASFGYNNYEFVVTVVGQYLLFIYSYFYLKGSCSIKKSTLLVFASYSFFHLLFFIPILSEINISHRFTGYHWDPNYLCAYVLIAFWAKIFILKNKYYKHYSIRLLIYVLLFFDVLMILSSMSKGGLLTLFLSSFLYSFIYNRKLFYYLIIVLLSFLLLALTRYQSLSWSTDLNLIDTLIYRIFTKSVENEDISTGRINFIFNYIKMLKSGDGVFFGMSIPHFIEHYNGMKQPHNGILEILISSGLMYGAFFSLYLFVKNIKMIVFSIYYKKLYYYSLISITSLFVLMFLSILGLKLSWFFFTILILYSNRNIYKQ